ncbi:hypothetical protein [Bernardetia sp.]|uniref:hypothetical protein n=1 Tax=Bernardetia sp. TaxID=1937974 RepID=UPI0025C5919F|nr:hypothetical protein [Bernardetia sp.]
MRFIASLNAFQTQELRRYLSSTDVKLLPRERKRFSAIYLSSFHKLTIQELNYISTDNWTFRILRQTPKGIST